MIEFVKSPDGIYRINDVMQINIGTIGKSANIIDYSNESVGIRNDEKTVLKALTGIGKQDILMLNQVHGDGIVIVDRPPEKDMPYFADADGMITDIPGICLVIRTADCVPVIAYDRKRKILGAVHSGWRGCRLSISRKLIAEMKHIYSSDARDIFTFILPSVGPESYTVNSDVAAFFEKDIIRKNPALYLDLWSNIERDLANEGVPVKNIFNARICTMKNGSEFFSRRNKDEGRNLNYCYFTDKD
jgi:hypothetical protein